MLNVNECFLSSSCVEMNEFSDTDMYKSKNSTPTTHLAIIFRLRHLQEACSPPLVNSSHHLVHDDLSGVEAEVVKLVARPVAGVELRCCREREGPPQDRRRVEAGARGLGVVGRG